VASYGQKQVLALDIEHEAQADVAGIWKRSTRVKTRHTIGFRNLVRPGASVTGPSARKGFFTPSTSSSCILEYT
jgi:hypothetical protein